MSSRRRSFWSRGGKSKFEKSRAQKVSLSRAAAESRSGGRTVDIHLEAEKFAESHQARNASPSWKKTITQNEQNRKFSFREKQDLKLQKSRTAVAKRTGGRIESVSSINDELLGSPPAPPVALCGGFGGSGPFFLTVNKITRGGTTKQTIQVSPQDIVMDVIARCSPTFKAELRHKGEFDNQPKDLDLLSVGISQAMEVDLQISCFPRIILTTATIPAPAASVPPLICTVASRWVCTWQEGPSNIRATPGGKKCGQSVAGDIIEELEVKDGWVCHAKGWSMISSGPHVMWMKLSVNPQKWVCTWQKGPSNIRATPGGAKAGESIAGDIIEELEVKDGWIRHEKGWSMISSGPHVMWMKLLMRA